MADLKARLQELADGAAHDARMPEAAVVARRGRRRRRWRAGGVALVVLVVAGGLVGLDRWVPRSTGTTPVAPPVSSAPTTSTQAPPRTPRPARGVVAEGSHRGVRWWAVAGKVSKHQVCWGLQLDTAPPGGDEGCTARPVGLSWGERAEGPSPVEKLVFGIVDPHAVRVRLTLKPGHSLDFTKPSLPPVDVEVVDGKGFPAGFFLTFIPYQTSVAQVEGFTAAGASVCRVFGDDWTTSRRLPVGCTNEPLPGG